VVAQKEELAQKNKDITDSIRYAKRIQWAILPEDPPFPDTFMLLSPRTLSVAIFTGFWRWGQGIFGCSGLHRTWGARRLHVHHRSQLTE
jgi:hypothetical protein